MAKKKTTRASKGVNKKAAVGIGVGVTAAVAAAAGAYFLYGSKNAEKNRRAVKSWMLHAKAEVLEGIENAKDITQEEYEDLVEGAAKVYGKLKTVSNREIEDFRREMKAHWATIEKKAKRKSAKKKGKKTTRKAAKKKPKKSAKKTSKKVARKRKK